MVKKTSQNLSNCKFVWKVMACKSAEQNLQGVSEKDLFVSPPWFLLFLLLLLLFGDFEFCLALVYFVIVWSYGASEFGEEFRDSAAD